MELKEKRNKYNRYIKENLNEEKLRLKNPIEKKKFVYKDDGINKWK